MEYNPLNLSALQVGLESGGHQLDPKTGKPLTSDKGAVGFAQVMPATAKEVAAKHGIPWDSEKFYYDRDYNAKLGDLYQGDLDEEFGKDTVESKAAYHSGPGTVHKLKAKYGADWASHLGPKGKQYIKVTKGIDVDSNDPSAAAAIALGIPTRDYSIGAPGPNESGPVMDSVSSVDMGKVNSKAQDAVDTSDNYTLFLQNAVRPLAENVNAQVLQSQKIEGIKRNIVNDFAGREATLEEKVKPLMARREEIANQLLSLDSMNPLDRRLKAIFNPNKYDPRMLRGQLERINAAMDVYQGDYEDLNKLRAGVAAASIDAEAADASTLETARQGTLNQLQLLGQVAGVVKQNVSDQSLPLAANVDVLRLQEATKQSLLGRLSLENINSLYQTAKTSPNGTVTKDGVTLTVGELQDAARVSQQQDLTFRNMVNAFKTGDMQTVDAMESNYIEHMTPEQINETMKNGGKIIGADGKPYQLPIDKLTSALASANQLREANVDEIVKGTAVGLAHSTLQTMKTQIDGFKSRAIEMFGNEPGESKAFAVTFANTINTFAKGVDEANQRGVGKEYIATNMPLLNSLNDQYEHMVDSVATKWGGGNSDLKAVAGAYLRGNPISGDAALKGLVVMARSGMPSGTKLSGPAAQAFEIAKATVNDWDAPAKGDSLDALMKGASHKEADLLRLVQQRVQSTYADSMAESVIQDLPALAKSVRDPNNPGRAHPFARVSREDFFHAVHYGDEQAYDVLANKVGVDKTALKAAFAAGPDSDQWKTLAQAKGLTDFGTLYQQLQALQMGGTLEALDASHSAQPGFSPAKAYVEFLQTPEVANRVAQAVQSYGQSGFGSYLISSSSGGGFKDAWDGYTQSVNSVYIAQHSDVLRQRIQQQRSIVGDPFVRFNAVNRAAGLTPQESQLLLKNVQPLVHLNATDPAISPTTGFAVGLDQTAQAQQNFDSIKTIVRTHKFDDPAVESIRRKVASQWDALDALVGTVFDSVNE